LGTSALECVWAHSAHPVSKPVRSIQFSQQTLFTSLNVIDWCVCLMEMHFVFCAVRTEFYA